VPPRLLAGPALNAGPESLHDHVARLGALPRARGDLIPNLEASGLLGRGGAAFPVGTKWRTVAHAGGGDARVLANGAEGEPLSAKDRAIMTLRPHLVLDGAFVAADAVGATEIVLYVGADHRDARTSLSRALAERAATRTGLSVPVHLVDAPAAYVAGEETAAVHFVNESDARPTTIPPRPFEAGIDGRPTLVQNVESLAYAALIARHGHAWYRAAGRGVTRGTALVTVTGAPSPGVREIDLGTTVGELATDAGLARDAASAVLLGGYFGAWVSSRDAQALPLDPAALRHDGRSFGCGVVSFLAADRCGVRATARIVDYMAAQSAAQCGPCVFGLRAIADTTQRIADGTAGRDDLARIERWTAQLPGRGACRHPDGAAGLLGSAFETFGEEFLVHVRTGRCSLPSGSRMAAA
jgi:NADH:ubiquinone oxidoreductase subunit F (NADH-binding)